MSYLVFDMEAVETAFTKRISGRLSEQRGNGLKFVRNVIETRGWSLEFFQIAAWREL